MDIKNFFMKNNLVNICEEYIDKDKKDKNMNVVDIIKQEQEVLKKLSFVPEHIVDIVKEYIPLCVFVFLDKNIYLNSRYFIMGILRKKEVTEKYIRYVIRRDFNYVFEKILVENIHIWYRFHKKYPYNNLIYTSYIDFLIDYCVEHESNKCKETITNLLEKLGLCKKDNKKIRTTNIRRWRR